MNATPNFESDLEKVFERFFKLDNKKDERELFCTLTHLEPKRSLLKKARDKFFTLFLLHQWSASKTCWFDRLALWESHLDRYCHVIRCGKINPSYSLGQDGDARIKLISAMLKTLDGKFSMLLAVNSVLAGFLGVSLREVNDLFNQSGLWPNIYFEWATLGVMVGALVYASVRSFFNIWYSVRDSGELYGEKCLIILTPLSQSLNTLGFLLSLWRGAPTCFALFLSRPGRRYCPSLSSSQLLLL